MKLRVQYKEAEAEGLEEPFWEPHGFHQTATFIFEKGQAVLNIQPKRKATKSKTKNRKIHRKKRTNKNTREPPSSSSPASAPFFETVKKWTRLRAKTSLPMRGG